MAGIKLNIQYCIGRYINKFLEEQPPLADLPVKYPLHSPQSLLQHLAPGTCNVTLQLGPKIVLSSHLEHVSSILSNYGGQRHTYSSQLSVLNSLQYAHFKSPAVVD